MKKPLTTLPFLPRHLAQLLLVLCLLPATSCQQNTKLSMQEGGDRPNTPTKPLTAVAAAVPGSEPSAGNATPSSVDVKARAADAQAQAEQPKTRKSKKKKPLTEEERKKKNEKRRERERKKKLQKQRVQKLQIAMLSYSYSLEDFSKELSASNNKRLLEGINSLIEDVLSYISKLAEGKASDVLEHFLGEQYAVFRDRYQEAEDYFKKIIDGSPEVCMPEDKALQALMPSVSTEEQRNVYEVLGMNYSLAKNIIDMMLNEKIVGDDLSAATQELLKKLKPIWELVKKNGDVPFYDRCTYFTVLKRLLAPSIEKHGSPDKWSRETMKKVLNTLLPPGLMTNYILSKNAEEEPVKFRKKFVKCLITAFRAKVGRPTQQAQFDRYTKELADAFGFSNKARDEARLRQRGIATLRKASRELFAPTQSPKKPGCSDATQPEKERKRTTRSNKAAKAPPLAKIKPVSHLDSPKPLIEKERKRVAHKQKTRKRGTIPSPSNEACVEAPTNERSSYITFLSKEFTLPKSLRMAENKFFHGATLPTEARQLSKKHQQVVDNLYDSRRKVTATCSEVEALWEAVGGKVKTSGGGSHHKIISFEGETLSPLWAVHGTGTPSYGPRFCKMLSAALLKRGILPTCLKEKWEQQQ